MTLSCCVAVPDTMRRHRLVQQTPRHTLHDIMLAGPETLLIGILLQARYECPQEPHICSCLLSFFRNHQGS